MTWNLVRYNEFQIPQIEDKIFECSRINQLLEMSVQKYKITVLQGYTGIGKTYDVISWLNTREQKERVVWIDCNEISSGMLKQLKEKLGKERKKSIIVIDQLQKVINKRLGKSIMDLVEHVKKNQRYILLTCGRVPDELTSFLATGRLQIIPQNKLLYTQNECQDYIWYCHGEGKEKNEIKPYPKALIRAPGIIDIYCMYGAHSFESEKQLVEVVNEHFYQCLDEKMYKTWSDELRKILLKVSLLGEVTKDQTTTLFGEKAFPILVEHAKCCCVLVKKNEFTYFVPEFFKEYMQRLVKIYLTEQECQMVYKDAAAYFKKNEDYNMAFTMYEKYKSYEEMVELLLLCFKNNCFIRYEQVIRKTIGTIPVSYMKKTPQLCVWICLKELFDFQIQKTRVWFHILLDLKEEYKNNKTMYKQLEQYILFLKFLLPFAKEAEMIKEVRSCYGKWCLEEVVTVFLQSSWVTIGVIRLLGQWSPTKEVKKLVKEPEFYKLIGESFSAVLDVHIGSYLYNQNQEEKCINYLSKGTANCKKNNIIGGYVTGRWLLLRYLSCNDSREIVYSVQKMKESLEGEVIENMEVDCSAALFHIKLLNNEVDEIEQWWEKHNSEYGEICNVLNFRYFMGRLRGMILKEQYMCAQAWLELLIQYCKQLRWRIVLVEVYTLYSIVYFRKNNKEQALEMIDKAINLAREYSLYQPIAEEGIACIEILDLYYERNKKNYEDYFFRELLDITRKFASRFPNYLMVKKRVDVRLTAAEIRMLEQLNTERSLSEIADYLCISLNTVKHHTKNIYVKLKVNKRTMAVKQAKELGII